MPGKILTEADQERVYELLQEINVDASSWLALRGPNEYEWYDHTSVSGYDGILYTSYTPDADFTNECVIFEQYLGEFDNWTPVSCDIESTTVVCWGEVSEEVVPEEPFLPNEDTNASIIQDMPTVINRGDSVTLPVRPRYRPTELHGTWNWSIFNCESEESHLAFGDRMDMVIDSFDCDEDSDCSVWLAERDSDDCVLLNINTEELISYPYSSSECHEQHYGICQENQLVTFEP